MGALTNKHTHKSIPTLRFSEFKGNNEWSYVHGNELFVSIVNKNHHSDLPVLAITQDQGAVPREMIDYNVIVSEKSIAGYKVVEIGDFIISLRSFQGGIEYSNYNGLCSPAYIILRKKDETICNDFYRHYFKSYQFIQDLNRNLEGIRDGKMISYQQFSEILIPYPPYAEQQRIAKCLSSIDECLKVANEKLELLKAHKQGLMQQLLAPVMGGGKTLNDCYLRLRFPTYKNTNEWEIKKLGDCFTERIERNRCDLPLLSLTESDGIILQEETNRKNNSNADKSKYLHVCIGDIAYNTMRMWQGRCAMVTIDGIVSPAYTILKPNKNINSKFFYYLFKTQQTIDTFHRNSQGLVSDTLNLKYENFAKIKVAVPALSEQNRISDCLSSCEETINLQVEKIMAFNQHKRGLMQQLFPQA